MEFIDHVRDVSSPEEVWDMLERLFTKKNTARLQLLENELAMLQQGGMSISNYFLRVKSICAEISEIDPEEKFSESCLRHYLIRGLKKEYDPFVTSIQGCLQQPSVEELENMLSNQEALAKEIAKNLEYDNVLFYKGKPNKKNASTWNKNKEEETSTEEGGNPHKTKKCYRCRKIGLIKKNCRVKLSKANVACTNEGDDQMKWEQYFSIQVVEPKIAQNFINYANNNKREEWIVDSGCSHHVTGDDSLFSEMRDHHEDRVIITADNSTYSVAKEGVVKIEVAGDKSKSIKLQDVYHVPGEKKGSLFVMSASEAYVKKTNQTDNVTIWHAQLDGLPTLKNVREDVICQDCKYGKSQSSLQKVIKSENHDV
ncbi:hypothetical protein KY289_030604 [Solanum tuberosum]|nr:hypothetical protein KY289_030604 [Solanum tuberosum]